MIACYLIQQGLIVIKILREKSPYICTDYTLTSYMYHKNLRENLKMIVNLYGLMSWIPLEIFMDPHPLFGLQHAVNSL